MRLILFIIFFSLALTMITMIISFFVKLFKDTFTTTEEKSQDKWRRDIERLQNDLYKVRKKLQKEEIKRGKVCMTCLQELPKDDWDMFWEGITKNIPSMTNIRYPDTPNRLCKQCERDNKLKKIGI